MAIGAQNAQCVPTTSGYNGVVTGLYWEPVTLCTVESAGSLQHSLTAAGSFNHKHVPCRLSMGESSVSGAKDMAIIEESFGRRNSRTEKFHKLFKSVPDQEYPIDYFSCAFQGDILLHGNLYVSQSWFCFYSRIKGRGRLLEIPMDKVITITREKTARFIPNAIGIQIAEAKFVFGSFIARDSTYRFLLGQLKKYQEKAELMLSSLESVNSGSLQVKYRKIESGTSLDQTLEEDCSSDSRILTEEELSVDSTNNSNKNNNNKSGENNLMLTHSSLKPDGSDLDVCLQSVVLDPCDHTDHSNACPPSKSSDTSPQNPSKQKSGFPYMLRCIDCQKSIKALWNCAVKLQRIPRTNLLLAICTVLVMFLLLSAVGLTYKILVLEAKLEAQHIWPQPEESSRSCRNMFGFVRTTNHGMHNYINSVLKANIDMLEEHMIGYTWQPVLMVEEEPGENLQKEPPTHEKLLTSFLTYPHWQNMKLEHTRTEINSSLQHLQNHALKKNQEVCQSDSECS